MKAFILELWPFEVRSLIFQLIGREATILI